jgi:threonine dehydrogenase-like Zn-dependent dehydrogenase
MAGGQAEFIRVPIADVNLLKVPPESEYPDEKLLFLSDILATAWYANELVETRENDVVAIWGAGPVGLLAAQCAFARGARRVILVDEQAYRLDFAKRILPKVETVNFAKDSSGSAGEKQVLELCKDEPAGGPDACIECVGMHYAHSFAHRLEMSVGLETDTPEALNAAIYACKKGGRIGVIGVYVGICNRFNFGNLMEKCINLHAGVVPLQKYWKQLLEMIRQGKLDPSVIITHRMNLDEAAKAYEMFNNKSDNCVKIILRPSPRGSAGSGTSTAGK